MSENTESPTVQARRRAVAELAAKTREDREARRRLRAYVADLETRAKSGEVLPESELQRLRADADVIEATVNWDRLTPEYWSSIE